MGIRYTNRAPREAQVETKLELLDSLERLAREVDRVRADQGFNALLRGIAKIWRYSILNHLMILFRYPKATSVHGAKQWEKQGRTIKPDAKGIVITAPSGTRGKYVWVEVFDVTQTDGTEIPESRIEGEDCPHIEDIELAAENLDIEVRDLSPDILSSHGGIPATVLGCVALGFVFGQ